jgi:hypothetical protein
MDAGVPGGFGQALAPDEDQASAGAQSAPTVLPHPWKATVTLPLSEAGPRYHREGGSLLPTRQTPPRIAAGAIRAKLRYRDTWPDRPG